MQCAGDAMRLAAACVLSYSCSSFASECIRFSLLSYFQNPLTSIRMLMTVWPQRLEIRSARVMRPDTAGETMSKISL